MPQRADGPPLIFSIAGVTFGVLIAYLLTKEVTMAVVFWVLGTLVVIGLHLRDKRRQRGDSRGGERSGRMGR